MATLTPVLDAVGILGACNDLYPDVPIERWDPFRAAYPELFEGDMWRLPVACTVIRGDGRTVLVDAGAGPPGRWSWDGEREGLLPAGLPDGIDTVFFTHLHVDHVGWLADPALFSEGRIAVHPDALAYALEHSSVEWLPGRLRELADEGRIDEVSAGDELMPGVRVVDFPGHYPGHVGLDVDGRAVLIGDAAPHPALLDQCGWHFLYDHDAPLASATRAALVEQVVDTETLVVCGHYPGSGIGHLVRTGERVEWREAA
jgi:glyoxylase-like metal-dependent hydrolase (beta-lactamase superfamily II)